MKYNDFKKVFNVGYKAGMRDTIKEMEDKEKIIIEPVIKHNEKQAKEIRALRADIEKAREDIEDLIRIYEIYEVGLYDFEEVKDMMFTAIKIKAMAGR